MSNRWLLAFGPLLVAVVCSLLAAGCRAPSQPPAGPEQVSASTGRRSFGTQQTRKPVIGYVTSAPRTGDLAVGGFQEFVAGLGEYGYIENENAIIEHRASEGDVSRFPDLIAELIDLPVDVLVIGDSRALVPAVNATRTIPIVSAVGDIFGSRLVSGLAHPSENLTGVTNLGTGLSAKRVELLHEMAPAARRLGALRNPTDVGAASFSSETEAAARQFGLALITVDVTTAAELDEAFERLREAGIEALIVLPEALTNLHARRIAQFSTEHDYPSMFGVRLFVEAGGLMFYGPNREWRFRRSAYFVDRILRGAKPIDLPIEQPARFDLAVNLKTAELLGIEVPSSFIPRVTEVIR